ncbi:MAG: hypothetical protein Q8R04_02930 [Nanoarchaeota archaeon]|nr:hypothetical protein [Nanoarchaeota archaeon]
MNKKTLALSLLIISMLALVVFAASSQRSPTVCAGQWSTCSNANADDTNRATFTATNTLNGSGRWSSYGFLLQNGAIITNVTVRADFFASNVRGFINVKVSGNNGATYGPSHVVGGNTAEQTFNIDVTNDLAWTPSMLNNNNLRVNATCFKSPTSGSNPTCRLDWVPMNVTYTPFDYSLSVSPSSDSVLQGNNATTTVTVSLVSGNSQNVFLSTAGCPGNASCILNPTSGLPSFVSELKVVTQTQNGTTPIGTYVIKVNSFGDGVSRSTNYTLSVV